MFGTIIADPSWMFDDSKAGMVKTGKGAASHYDCLPLEKICSYLQDTCLPNTDIPLAECIADHAHLWLWVPNAFVIEGVGAQVAKAWGFKAKTLVTWAKGRLDVEWVKNPEPRDPRNPCDGEGGASPRAKVIHQIGQGSWIRNSTEQLVFCVRGKAPPAVRNLPSALVEEGPAPDEWMLEPRTQHSRKPDTIHRWAEAMSPGPRLELFARRRMPGWTAVGKQLPVEP